MRVSTAFVLLAAVAAIAVHATITPNPDTWELPPAAPNYSYGAQGLLGSGASSTLVLARDPNGLNGYNTSLFSFSVSGGLVPLNFLNIGPCRSTFAANVLLCDSPGSGAAAAVLYQLGLDPSNGRVVIESQFTADFAGPWGDVAPVFIESANAVLFAAYNFSAPQTNGIYPYSFITISTTGAFEPTVVGSVTAAELGSQFTSMAISANADFISFSTYTNGIQVLSYPGFSPSNAPAANFDNAYLLPTTSGDIGVVVSAAANNAGVVYTTFDFASNTATGATPTVDTATTYYSYGLNIASSGTTATQLNGPCVYVAGYRLVKDGQYTTLSQVSVANGAASTSSVEAQVTATAALGKTVVANANYLFAIFGEIMYRWKVTC